MTIADYQRLKWKLTSIRPNSKSPVGDDWNLIENALPDGAQLAPGYGVGLMHAYSGTCAIDIDDWDTAVFNLGLRGIDLVSLYQDPTTVKIHSGSPGHAKMLFRLPLPLPSVKLTANKKNFIDFRCGTVDGKTVQDVLPPHRHPDTGYDYSWEGDPAAITPLPDELQRLWAEELATRRTATPNRLNGQKRPLEPLSDDDMASVRGALGHIPPDIDRDEWVSMAMGLHATGREDAYETFDTWSRGGVKYMGEKDTAAVWRSIKERGDGVGVGSVFHLARRHGWKPTAVDIKAMFGSSQVKFDHDLGNAILNPNEKIDTVPEIPIEAEHWPPIWYQRAQEVAQSVGCDPMIPLMAGLSAISAAIDSRRKLFIREDFVVPPVIWTAVIGRPSSKKSPGSKAMFSELRRIEAEHASTYEAEMNQHKVKEEQHKVKFKQYVADTTGIDPTGNTVVPPAPLLESAPKLLRIIGGDMTPQAVVKRCADNPRGIMINQDELSGLFSYLADPRNTTYRETYIHGFETGPRNVDRASVDSYHAENVAISMFGNIQPAVLEKYAETLSTDGMLQRWIMGYLHDRHIGPGNPIPDALSCRRQWDDLIRSLWNVGPWQMTLSPQALAIFREYEIEHYRKRKEGRGMYRIINQDDMLRSSAGKIVGQIARLALIFECVTPGGGGFDDPGCPLW